MAGSAQSYAAALSLLDSLQSNLAVQAIVKSSDRDLNQDAMPEMLDWVQRAGYSVEDFNTLKVIHVAGTKGKGSVSVMISSILQQYGTEDLAENSTQSISHLGKSGRRLGRIGLYTSPHLVTVRERIRINGIPISQSLFTTYFFELWERLSSSAAAAGHPDPMSPETKPGFFRYMTIMALHVFIREGVESAVIECGIGGEYDSTNILRKESVTLTSITKLGIDHVGMLGSTIEGIAWHKAGIIKDGVQCFTVPQPDQAMKVLKERAKEKNTVIQVVGRKKEVESGQVKLGLEGDFQKENAALAIESAIAHLETMGVATIRGFEKLPVEFVRGLELVRWEGRCEVRKEGNIEWYIDGAHTMESIAATAKWFSEKLYATKSQSILIFNQQTRDASALVGALHMSLERLTGRRHIFHRAVFCGNTPFKTSNVDDEQSRFELAVQHATADAWSDFEPDSEAVVFSSVEEAVNYARDVSNEQERVQVLVTGSLHLVGGLLKVLEGQRGIS